MLRVNPPQLDCNIKQQQQQQQSSQEVTITATPREFKSTSKELFELKLRNKINEEKKKNRDVEKEEEAEEEEVEELNEVNEIEYLAEINRKCTDWLEKYVLPNFASKFNDKTIHI